MNIRSQMLRWSVAVAVTAVSAAAAEAQAWNYPSFQRPTVTTREFNFAIADDGDQGRGNGGGTSLVFQWREGVGRSQLSLDVGFADADNANSDTYLLLGGQFATSLATANASMPLDLLLTAGVNVAAGDPFNVVRIPVGLSAGHRFPLEGQMAITPFAHPRVSFDLCGDGCIVRVAPGGTVTTDDSDIAISVDLGVAFEFNPSLALHLSAMMTGSDIFADDDAFGISLSWKPLAR